MSKTSVDPIRNLHALDDVPANTQLPSKRHAEHEKSVKQAELELERAGLSNVTIHFDVDEETERLVVIVKDRASGRVLRAIPASEFQKLRAGELLKLTA
jgi:uncharacterized FlaG/YvyC family protein